MTLGERIKEARLRKRLTQKQLAKLLNVTDATVNRYEKNVRKPDAEMLKRIAEILGVSVDYLLGTEEKHETIAAHRSDNPLDDLPEEAKRSIEEFKEYILKKYGLM